ncbi:hypothetical protein [Mesorhizobium australafricanum]|uniref:Transposase n=1 Tax=Mesorhizobium australafricanum TaxID=3072311 RepID=A0ABU4X2I9_9HYPH|nr:MULTISPECIES: hypothetical protein [unclassified Mesorhizobium]MDX8442530.1 hypothetical protein [Mesorhizobium sp. VK3E]MDX8457134.1 hypothetical protein [Mesorhizobium sp. VK9D]
MIDDEVVEVQPGWLQLCPGRPTSALVAVKHKDAAIIAVLLLGYAGRLQAGSQPLCELCRGLVVVGSAP